MSFLFLIQKGKISGKFELKKNRTKIGRNLENDIVLNVSGVSRFHAEIDYDEDQFLIRDQNSTRGVFVNDLEVAVTALKINDRIRLGDARLVFCDCEENLCSDELTGDNSRFKEQYLNSVFMKVEESGRIDRKWVEGVLQDTVNEMYTAYEIGQAITSTLKVDSVLNLVMDKIFEFIGARRGFIVLIDASGNLVPRISRDMELDSDSGMRVSQTIIRKVLDSGEAFLSTDAKTDSRVKDTESVIAFQIRTVMCVPLKVKSENIGAIYLEKDSGMTHFSQKHLSFLNLLANQVAIAVYNATLFENLENAHRELKETQAHLVQSGKMAAVGQMASGIAHELNNPLGAIYGFLQLMEDQISRNEMDRDELKNYVQISLDACRSLQDIVSNLLEFSSPREDFSPVEVNEAVNRTLSLISVKLRKNKIRLNLKLSEKPLKTSGVPGQLRQVFLNLIVNAYQAMEGGGELEIETKSDSGMVFVIFRDHGCGMEKKVLDHIFEPFFTTKEAGRGTGLGLYICHRIVENHQGMIVVESEPGQGTSFIIKLPENC